MANRRLRLSLFNKQDGLCHYCTEKMNLGRPHPFNEAACTIDHREPKCHGNGYWKNAVGACHRCNQAKGSMSYEEFVALIARVPLPPLVRQQKPVMVLVPLVAAAPASRKRGLPAGAPHKGATYSLGELLGPMLASAAE